MHQILVGESALTKETLDRLRKTNTKEFAVDTTPRRHRQRGAAACRLLLKGAKTIKKQAI